MELTHERKTVFVPHWSRYVVGCDIGQSVDPTAIAVVEHLTGVNDSGSDWERHTGLSKEFQQAAVQFNVRHLECLPLQTRYGDVVRYVANLLAKPPLCSTEDKRAADLVVDASGVGMGVCDMFSEAGMRPIKIVITAGGEVATCTGPDRWNISKHALITQLDAMLSHDKRPLRFASALTEREAMKDELRDFQRHVGSAGRHTYAARVGKHDDLVMSVTIAAWWISRPQQEQASSAVYSGYAAPGQGY